MKKIISFVLVLFISFTYSSANIGDSTSVNKYELLKSQVFYINGEGYIKENGKLKKIKGVKFYSIAGRQYAKVDGKLIKLKNNTIKKINGIIYVIENGKIMTLEKFLIQNPIKKDEIKTIKKELTFSDVFYAKKIENPKLTIIKKSKLNYIKQKTLSEIQKIILEKYPNSKDGILKYLSKKNNQTKDNFAKLKEIYFKKKDYELAKKFFILENIEKIDIDKINKIIKSKQSGDNIIINKSKIDNDEDELSKEIENMFINFGELDEVKVISTNTGSIDNNTNTGSVDNSNNTNTDDEDLNEILNIFNGL